MNDIAYQDAKLASHNSINDRFVHEYLKDYDAIASAMRLGYPHGQAVEAGPDLLKTPYVQSQLQQQATAALDNPEAMKKKVFLMLLREANFDGLNSSHSARVTASINLYKILQDQTTVAEDNEKGAIGGVMIVPPVGDVSTWGARASESQADLKRRARE